MTKSKIWRSLYFVSLFYCLLLLSISLEIFTLFMRYRIFVTTFQLIGSNFADQVRMQNWCYTILTHIAASAEYAVSISLWVKDSIPWMWSPPTNVVSSTEVWTRATRMMQSWDENGNTIHSTDLTYKSMSFLQMRFVSINVEKQTMKIC